jgi:hypothetical protein
MMEDFPPHLNITSRQQLDQLLLEGKESGDLIPVTDEWWAAKRQQLLARIDLKRRHIEITDRRRSSVIPVGQPEVRE